MYKITANDWDGIGLNRVYGSYRNTKVNNTKMKQIAEKYAAKGRDNPSPLERMMIEFLKSHYIKYEFQKPCCIYSNGVIIQFFIVDFYIPSRRLIIETDGKYHDEQVEYDDYRTKAIIKQHPEIELIRWRYNDFKSVERMECLLELLQEN